MAVALKPYTEQQTVSATPGTPQAPVLDQDARSLASITQSGETLMHARALHDRVLQHDEDQRAIAKASEDVSDAAVKLTQYRRDLQDSTPDDPTGFTPQIHKAVDDYAGTLLAQTPNAKAKLHVATQMAAFGRTEVLAADSWERKQQEVYSGKQLDTILDNYSRVLVASPDSYSTIVDGIAPAIEGYKIPPDVRQKFREHANQVLTEAATRGFIEQSPLLAQKLINRRLGIPEEAPAPTPGAPTSGAAPIDLTRPAIQNADGSISTERTITVESEGKHYLIPTIVDGKQRSNDEAVALWRSGKNASVGTFGSNADAEAAAVARSKRIGELRSGSTVGADASFTDYKIPAGVQASRDQARLGILQTEYADAQKRQAAGDANAPGDLAGLTKEITRMGAQPGVVPRPSSPAQVAQNMSDTMVDVAPPVVQLDPVSVTAKVNVPFLDNLDAKQLLAMKGHADTLAHKDAAAAQSTLRAFYHNAGAQAERGVVPDAPPPDLVTRAVGSGHAAEEMAKFDTLRTYAGAIGSVQTMPAGAMAARYKQLGPINKDDPEFAEKAKYQDDFKRAAGAVLKARADDPMGAAQSQGIATIAPLDPGKPGFAAELANRQSVAIKMVTQYGATNHSAFTKDEATAYAQNWHRFDTGQQLGALSQLHDGLTDPRVYRDTVGQIKPDSPALFMAASLGSRSSVYAAPDGTPAKQVAFGILEGDRILHPDKYAAKEDGKGRTFNLPPTSGNDGMDAYLANKLGSAFVDRPEEFAQAKQAIYGYYAYLASGAGKYDGTVDNSLLDTASDRVLGKTGRWSQGIFSNQKVLMPWGMKEEDWRPQISAAYDRAMTSAGLKGSSVDKAANTQLVPLDEYHYGLRSGTSTIKGTNGRPVVLDISPIEAQP